jgi:hypothetical protein
MTRKLDVGQDYIAILEFIGLPYSFTFARSDFTQK